MSAPPASGGSGGARGSKHNAEDCSGTFRVVRNPSDDADSDPPDLVCPLCGAWRPVEPMDGKEPLVRGDEQDGGAR